MATSYVTLPIEYFPDPTQGRPVYNGSVYVGEPDLDPEVLANRKTVTLKQEDNSEVVIPPESQPLTTGAGGVIMYNGSPVTVLVEGSYSLKVLDRLGAQVYYVHNVLDAVPVDQTQVALVFDTVADMKASAALEPTQLARTKGYYAINDGGGALYVIQPTQAVDGWGDHGLANGNVALLQFDGDANVRCYGAKGDGTTDDYTAIQAAIDSNKAVYFPVGSFAVGSTLLFDNNHFFSGKSKGGLLGVSKIIMTSSLPVFQARTSATTATFHPVFDNLTIENADTSGRPSGSVGIDLTRCSYYVVTNCATRHHNIGIRLGAPNGESGHYGLIQSSEIVNSAIGIRNTGSNSSRYISNRIFSCATGIYAEISTDVFVTGAIETTDLGIILQSGCQGWFINSRLESSGGIEIAPGAFNNHIFSFRSGGTDRVIDLDGRNFDHTKSTGLKGQAPYAIRNQFANESMTWDGDGSGIADGLTLSVIPTPAGSTLSLTTTVGEFVTGTTAQKYVVAAAGTTRADLRLTQPLYTTPGVQYTIAVRVKVSKESAWSIRGGSSPTYNGIDYGNIPIPVANKWVTVQSQFTATADRAYIYIYMPSSTAGGGASDVELLVDAIYFGIGLNAPSFGQYGTPSGSETYNPQSLSPGEGVTATVVCAGAAIGDYVSASFSNDLQGIILTAWVSNSDTVSVRFQNNTAGVIDLSSGVLRVQAKKEFL